MIRTQHGGLDLLDAVEPLWESLRDFHAERSTWFKPDFRSKRWEDRRDELAAKADGGEIRISLVFQEGKDEAAGYCISTLDKQGTGELDSLYVIPDLRGFGTASGLIRDHLRWLQDLDADPVQLYVAEGNEGVKELYSRFGFHPHSLTLQISAIGQEHTTDTDLADRSGIPELQFGDGSLELLPAIEPLWLALREHHIRTSPHFAEQFLERDYDREKLALMYAHRKGSVAIQTVATPSGILMGYCIVAGTAPGEGVIESLYIRPEIRGIGAGVKLIASAVHWLHEKQCEKVRVRVAVGNEEAVTVYEKAGFRLRAHLMEYKG